MQTIESGRAELWRRHYRQMSRAYDVEGAYERWLQNTLNITLANQSVILSTKRRRRAYGCTVPRAYANLNPGLESADVTWNFLPFSIRSSQILDSFGKKSKSKPIYSVCL